MMQRRSLLALPFLAAPARAQEVFPSRPMRFVVPFAAGGNTDAMARLYGAFISRRLGQPVVVENRTGAAGAIGTEAVVRSRPDGYTMLLGSPGSIINGPLLTAQPRFDPLADLTPVAMLGQVPLVIITRPALPIRTLAELVRYSREHPQGVSIGTSGIGGAHHLPLELFKAATGANLVHVPFRGGGATLPDFLAGNLDGTLIELSTVVDLHKDGRGRILAVASPARSPLLPEIPTFIEQGFPGFLAASFVALFAPAGTPEGVLATVQRVMAEATQDPEVKARMRGFGADLATPEELTTPGMQAFLRSEREKAQRAIGIAGLKPE
jgi:tripartite-type tricarboxylate transporter receptor subunit TctC